MSGYTSAPRAFRPATAAAPVALRGGSAAHGWARAFWARLVLMRRAAMTRRELGTLNPRLLADIGLTRAEAEREAERWPWDLEPNRLPGRATGAHW
jgi:uncharacterized protein YjiS (DUF1127 family)